MVRTLKNKQSGFTLVELLVVVAIVGILATAGIPQYRRMIAKSKQAEAKTALSDVSAAQSSFFSEFGVYGTNLRAMGVQSDITDQAGVVTNAGVVSKSYLYGFMTANCAAGAAPAALPPAAAVPFGVAINNANTGYYNSFQDSKDAVGAQNLSSTIFGRTSKVGNCSLAAVAGSLATIPVAPAFSTYNVIASGTVYPGINPDTGTITSAINSQVDVWSVDQTRAINNQIKGFQ